MVSNFVASNGRVVMMGTQRRRIKKSTIPVNGTNAELLQLLDSISQAEKYTELTKKETIEVLISYVKQKKFSKELLTEVLPALTGATAKKLIEWGIIYEFAS